jgi:hypothetical protein
MPVLIIDFFISLALQRCNPCTSVVPTFIALRKTNPAKAFSLAQIKDALRLNTHLFGIVTALLP